MKELIILSGLSGIGKTTSFLPYLQSKGYRGIETGDLFKAVIGGIYSGGLSSESKFDQAKVSSSLSEHFAWCLSRYEQDWKPEIGDVQTSYAFEYLRMVEWSFHVKSVFMLADLWQCDKVVTSVINNTELDLVLAVAKERGVNCRLIVLNCTSAKNNTGNRQIVDVSGLAIPNNRVTYALNSDGVRQACRRIDQILSMGT